MAVKVGRTTRFPGVVVKARRMALFPGVAVKDERGTGLEAHAKEGVWWWQTRTMQRRSGRRWGVAGK
jgi:hypothetical protein